MPIDTLTVREASFVTEIPLNAVNRAIDEHRLLVGLIRKNRVRLLTREGLIILAFEKELEHRIPPAIRKDLLALAANALQKTQRAHRLGAVSVQDGPLRIEVSLKAIASRIETNWDRLAEAMSLIVEDPNIQAGAPTFRETRIMVYPVADALERGVPAQELLEDYKALTPKMLDAARLYARVRPRRGRPRAETRGMIARSGPRVIRRHA